MSRLKQGGMLPPDQLLGGYLGEMYRYRLALHDQESRITAAVAALRAARDRIDEQMYEALFLSSTSPDEFGTHLQSLKNQEIPEIWRLKTEAQFLLVAVRGMYVMAGAAGVVAPASVGDCIQNALAAFDAAAPDAIFLRHIHEHLDEYVAGTGRQTDRLSDPTALGIVAMLDEGLVYWIGGKLFRLGEITRAAEELARKVAECTREVD